MKKNDILTHGDHVAAHELHLFAVNDFRTYHQLIIPALDNLRKKMKRGQYDETKALKLWEHVAEYAARQYHSMYGTPGQPWYAPFPANVRRFTAKTLALHFEDELNPA